MAELCTCTWLFLLLIIALFSGLIAIGSAIIDLIGHKLFGTGKKDKW